MLIVIIQLLFMNIVQAITPQCSTLEVKSLKEGCDRLTGLNLSTVGGTLVNDHNCNVMLPKQVFLEEPVFQYLLADSVSFLNKPHLSTCTHIHVPAISKKIKYILSFFYLFSISSKQNFRYLLC